MSVYSKNESSQNVNSQPIFAYRPDTALFVGVDFHKHKDINFNTEEEEEDEWNAIILKSVSIVIKKTFKQIYKTELPDYDHLDCVLAMVTLVNYQEKYVGGGERKGLIEIQVDLFDNPHSKTPVKSYVFSGTGSSDYGHSNPLKYAIENACVSFEKQELQFNRFRYGFGPGVGLNMYKNMNLFLMNFVVGGTYGRHVITIPLSAGFMLQSDIVIDGNLRDTRDTKFWGLGIDYMYSLFQTEYYMLGPSVIVGYWQTTESVIHEERNPNLIYTQGASGSGFYEETGKEVLLKSYLAAPGIEYWIGKAKFQVKIESRIYFGINTPPMFSVRSGVMFMKR
jgi:hypothetical protein